MAQIAKQTRRENFNLSIEDYELVSKLVELNAFKSRAEFWKALLAQEQARWKENKEAKSIAVESNPSIEQISERIVKLHGELQKGRKLLTLKELSYDLFKMPLCDCRPAQVRTELSTYACVKCGIQHAKPEGMNDIMREFFPVKESQIGPLIEVTREFLRRRNYVLENTKTKETIPISLVDLKNYEEYLKLIFLSKSMSQPQESTQAQEVIKESF